MQQADLLAPTLVIQIDRNLLMKKLLVASLIATTSLLVAIPAASASAGVSSVAHDKSDKADKVKKDKADKKAKKVKKDKADKKAKMAKGSSAGVGPGGLAQAALADSDKVTICHRTNSAANPYVQITPATAGVANGHDGHAGGVFTPALEAAGTKWGDIIPPYVYRGVQYPGQNWTTAGQALFNNGCDLPDEVDRSPIAVATASPTVVPPTCEQDGRLVLPIDENVFYTSNPPGSGPGVYTVTATPEVGHVLTGETEWVLEVGARLSGDDCAAVAGVSAQADDSALLPDVAALLPDTGGPAFWMLIIGGAFAFGGAALVRGARRLS